MVFSTKDIQFNSKYDFITKELDWYEFFLEIDSEGLCQHLEYGIPLDRVIRTGFYNYNGKNYRDYWVYMLEELIDDREFDEDLDDLYIDFKWVFEDICVELFKKFEEYVEEYIEEVQAIEEIYS